MTQGQHIRHTREAKGLSPRYVALGAGMTEEQYLRIESDEHPCGEYMLEKIAKGMGVFIDDLRITSGKNWKDGKQR